MQFSTKFTLLFILFICCLTVQAQPPNDGDPSSIHVGGGAGSASPWGKVALTAGYEYTFLQKNNDKRRYDFSLGADYTPINFKSKTHGYTQISIPALLQFYPYQNKKTDGAYRYLEIAGGTEIGFLLGAKPANSSIKQLPIADALKNDNLNRTNTFGVLRLDYGGNRLGVGIRYAIALTEKEKRFKTSQIYMRLKLSKSNRKPDKK